MGEIKKNRNAKGEGSFKVNENGTITHRKCVGFKANGRRKTLTVTEKTKSACIRKMREKEAKWERIKSISRVKANDTVSELCYKHLAYQIANGDLRGKSIDRRECTINNQIAGYDIGKYQVHMVTSEMVKEHINLLISEGRVGESSITKAFDVLNAAFQWALGKKDVESNPVSSIKPEVIKKLKKMKGKGSNEADVAVLSDDEVVLFEKEATMICANGKRKYPAGLYCLLLLHTGMRVGEMIALRWKDWKGEYLVIEKSISVMKNREKQCEQEANYISMEGATKNQKARIIQLNKEARQILAAIQHERGVCDPDDLIAPTKTGEVNTATNLEHRMKIILKNAGLSDIEGGLHIFRKTFATRMYENGGRVEEIAAYIGDLESTTRKYYIAIRKKMMAKGQVQHVVELPGKKEQFPVA